jgi:hypothetical protein
MAAASVVSATGSVLAAARKCSTRETKGGMDGLERDGCDVLWRERRTRRDKWWREIKSEWGMALEAWEGGVERGGVVG